MIIILINGFVIMFLCAQHRQDMAKQSPQELNQIIDNWVSKAVSHYQQQRWEFALPYAGCALEICWLLGNQQKVPFRLVEKSLCLAIYCHNILSHQQEKIKGEAILLNNWQWIMHTIGYENRPDFIKHCLDICQNATKHQEVINKHTDWPFINADELKQLIYH